jgi:hypothetical protein
MRRPCRAHRFRTANLPDLEPLVEPIEEGSGESIAIHFVAAESRQGSSEQSGAEDGATNIGLDVQVDLDAEDGVSDVFTAHSRLHERPSDLLAIHDDIVRPLDASLNPVLVERVHERERGEEREQRQFLRPQRLAEEH